MKIGSGFHRTATPSADIVEIFSSLQGEGLHAGLRMTFVRFGGCSMRCCFCDTPQGLCSPELLIVESPPGSAAFAERPNPVTVAALSEILAAFDDRWLSVTGGEPLEQAAFLETWLPAMFPSHHILLETNGIHHAELLRVLPFVHVISMDFKLPSSTGRKPCWHDHAAFLEAAISSGREVSVKIVVTGETTDRDIQEAIGIVTRLNRYTPVVIQPAEPTLRFHGPPSEERLAAVERLCAAYLPDVRVVPQMHKRWGVL